VGGLRLHHPRVLTRIFTNIAGQPQNSASQKAAALSAIAALSKRLAGGGAPSAGKDRRVGDSAL